MTLPLRPSRRPATARPPGRHQGIALPVVLVLMTLLAFSGLIAARRSATVEDIANNTRVAHVAQLAAQSALRHCESVVIESVDGGSSPAWEVGQVAASPLLSGPQDPAGRWLRMENWIPGTPYLIELPLPASGTSPDSGSVARHFCMAEALAGQRFLITARGLSVGAVVDAASGRLVANAGGEVWLQAIVAPSTPVLSASGSGYE